MSCTVASGIIPCEIDSQESLRQAHVFLGMYLSQGQYISINLLLCLPALFFFFFFFFYFSFFSSFFSSFSKEIALAESVSE